MNYICFKSNTGIDYAKSKLFLALLSVILLISCNDNKTSTTPQALTDAEILAFASKAGYEYYRVDTVNANGPHGPFILVRYNETAQSVLDANNKLPAGASFPEGSTIVKEVFNQLGGTLIKQYVMHKKATDPNSALNWVWAGFDADGSVNFPVSNKGVGCKECHATNPNRDGAKIFDIY